MFDDRRGKKKGAYGSDRNDQGGWNPLLSNVMVEKINKNDETDERRVEDGRSSVVDEDFPADRQDVSDQRGDEEYRPRTRVPSGWIRSMNSRLFVTYRASNPAEARPAEKYK